MNGSHGVRHRNNSLRYANLISRFMSLRQRRNHHNRRNRVLNPPLTLPRRRHLSHFRRNMTRQRTNRSPRVPTIRVSRPIRPTKRRLLAATHLIRRKGRNLNVTLRNKRSRFRRCRRRHRNRRRSRIRTAFSHCDPSRSGFVRNFTTRQAKY